MEEKEFYCNYTFSFFPVYISADSKSSRNRKAYKNNRRPGLQQKNMKEKEENLVFYFLL
jgi:hypothetical protein